MQYANDCRNNNNNCVITWSKGSGNIVAFAPARYKKAFDALDADGDGVITLREAAAKLEAFYEVRWRSFVPAHARYSAAPPIIPTQPYPSVVQKGAQS